MFLLIMFLCAEQSSIYFNHKAAMLCSGFKASKSQRNHNYTRIKTLCPTVVIKDNHTRLHEARMQRGKPHNGFCCQVAITNSKILQHFVRSVTWRPCVVQRSNLYKSTQNKPERCCVPHSELSLLSLNIWADTCEGKGRQKGDIIHLAYLASVWAALQGSSELPVCRR